MRHSIVLLVLICLIGQYGCQPAANRTDDPAPAQVVQVVNAPLAGPDGDDAQPHDRSPDSADPTDPPSAAKKRAFSFRYAFRVKDLPLRDNPAEHPVRVWLPCPTSNEHQQVERGEATAPGPISEHTEARYGNRILYLETPLPEQGEFAVDVPFRVVRHEVLLNASRPTPLDDDQRAQYLRADVLAPIDGKPLELLKGITLDQNKLRLARQLYDIVDAHVVYKKEGTGWGRGDTNWVCDNGYGNCTDFHSLFISLARSQGLPARFEIGFSIPTDKTEGPISGYHCWAWFYLEDRGWLPVDISEADKHPELKEYYFGDLTADRVMFSAGRDLVLEPPSAQEPLNFFIYPHIEIDGQALTKEQIELQFSFADQDE